MELLRLKQIIIDFTARLINVARDSLLYARKIFQKPAAIPFLLRTSYKSCILVAVIFILLVTVAPVIVDAITSTVFPPDTSKKIFGLIKNQHANPLKGLADLIFLTMVWIVSIGPSLLYLMSNISDGLARANNRAGKLLELSNNCSNLTNRQKILEKALSLTTDGELELKIISKFKEATISEFNPNHEHETEITISSDIKSAVKDSQSTLTVFQNRYTLGPLLGKGAMGAVYRARDNVLDREIAIKQLPLVLSNDEEYALRFRQEAKALARLTHPNIVQVYDLIEDGKQLWMTLEFVDGGDLASYLQANGPLSILEAMDIVIPLTEGLAYAHDQGIIHRDLKPANILLTNKRIPKITDFGIAKLSRSSYTTEVGTVLGSPRYMSPEQCSGSATDLKTDIYALGITLYEILTAKAPFEGDRASVMARQVIEEPLPLSKLIDGVPSDLEKITLSMLAKNPDNRPLNMHKVAESILLCKDRILSSSQAPAQY